MGSRLFVVVATFALASCGTITHFPLVSQKETKTSSLGTNVTVIPMTASVVAKLDAAQPAPAARTSLPGIGHWIYKIGLGDVLDVVIWDHPELTLPSGSERTPAESGQVVQPDGNFYYPYIGEVHAAGRTPVQIRDDMAEKIAKYIPDPQMVVRVAAFNSQSVSVTGQVNKPAKLPLTSQPLTLLQAIDAAGGLNPDTADAHSVIIRRHGHIHTVDLQGFLDQGVGRNNPVLIDGDVVNVPQQAAEQAFLLGQISKPAPVDLSKTPVSLTQALTTVGGLDEKAADARGVFVFRPNATKGVTVYQLDAANPIAYVIGAKFMLRPNDVVYVTSAPLTRWNYTIGKIMPTISAIYQISHLDVIFE